MFSKSIIQLSYIIHSESGSGASSKSGSSSSKSESEQPKETKNTSTKNSTNKKPRRRTSSELQPVYKNIYSVILFKLGYF